MGEIIKFSRKSELKSEKCTFSLVPLSLYFPRLPLQVWYSCFSLLSFLWSSVACQPLEMLGEGSDIESIHQSQWCDHCYWPRALCWCPKGWYDEQARCWGTLRTTAILGEIFMLNRLVEEGDNIYFFVYVRPFCLQAHRPVKFANISMFLCNKITLGQHQKVGHGVENGRPWFKFNF